MSMGVRLARGQKHLAAGYTLDIMNFQNVLDITSIILMSTWHHWWPCVSLSKIITFTRRSYMHTRRKQIGMSRIWAPRWTIRNKSRHVWRAPHCHPISGWAWSAAWIHRLLGVCTLSADQQLPRAAVRGCSLWKIQKNWSKQRTTKLEQVNKMATTKRLAAQIHLKVQ